MAALPNLDYRQNLDLIRFQSERDRITREAATVQSDLNTAECELEAAVLRAEELELEAILDSGKTKEATAARKHADGLAAKITELRTRAKRYPRVLETVHRMALQKEKELARGAQAEIRARYERAVSMLASALDAAAEANSELIELEDAANTIFGVRMKNPIYPLNWKDLAATDRNAFINEWLMEVAQHHPAALPENHPARIRHRQKEATFTKNEKTVTDKLQAEEDAWRESLNRPNWNELQAARWGA